jgi:hypothetical protein
MAERRMFAKTIVTSDAFLDMPASSRCLYFLLGMVADDDGFVNNPKSIMRQAGSTADDLNLLIAKRFILTFQSGVVVIKHWCIHNTIQKDRYKETKYLEEKATLMLDDNRAYTEAVHDVYPDRIQDVSRLEPQDRLVQDKLIQSNLIEDIDIGPAAPPKPVRHRYGRYKNVLLTDDEMDKLKDEFPRDWGDRIERLSEYMASTGKSYKNFLATIRNWAKRDGPQKQVKKGNSFMDLVEDAYE